MVDLHPEYVVDAQRRPKAVLLPLAEWERILEALEDLEDLRAYDEARNQAQDALPFDQAVREIRQGRVE
ncbi:MAG TPA: hypothetical protein PLS90_05090 [Candidatus Sumerlaeota bacterium]|nr:MAG: hypothetical protein BWZ08_02436 [candidate division BRC1 bacterium ADurb.BinA292]HOE96465.1 hypothetical protein [Candidatus Sumerlaeota bacterium]HOR26764.1 hypothetical protein [Candidatus Sumerlaeota bacterium]HPK01811.1 hypothetical protein [Candidatus Sumerlaeota bacterium]